MKKIFFFAFAFLVAQNVHAQEGKIIKAKGNRAVVQFPAGTELHNGDMISLDSLDAQIGGKSSGPAMNGPRDRTLGFEAALISGSSSAGGSHTALSANARFGWNKLTMEYGPLGSFSTTTPNSTTSFGVGGFFDYNLIPNSRGKELVYGVGGSAQIGSTSNNGSATTMTIAGGGFVKWFPLGNTVAVRGDADLQYVRTSASSTTTSDTALVITGGLQVYF